MKTVAVLSVGVINIPTGKTMYDWGIYDKFWNNSMYAFLTTSGRLLFSTCKNDFTLGESVLLRNNDTNRKIAEYTIQDVSIVNKELLMAMLKDNGFDYTPLRPFTSRPKNNRKLDTSYSVKGFLS